MKCPKCGTENAPDAQFCLQCGQELTAAAATCPNCHAPVVPGAVFCSQCGQRLAPAPAQAPVLTQPMAAQTPMAPTAAPASTRPSEGGGPLVMQTSTGNKNLQVYIENVHGSNIDINYNPTEEPEPLPLPVDLRPPVFPALLDRQPELQDVAQALAQRAPVEISGEAGQGKTSLLRSLGNSPAADVQRFPGGVVYFRSNGQPEPDLLQSLFGLFYKLPQNYKPSPEEIQRGLHALQALVLLDDVILTRDQLTDLRSQAPNCTFVLASTERALWGEGRALALGGLPADESLALIERELGRPLTPQEQPAARQLCTALKGFPDRLLKTAAHAREGQPFESILQSMAQAPLTPILLSGLPTPEMRVLSVLALARRSVVPLEHIAPLADLPDVRQPLQVLQQRRLVQAHSPSYSLTGTLAQELWRDWDLTPWADRALDYFVQWTEAIRADPRRIFDSLDVILSLLEWAVGKQRWAQVLRLGRAIQAALALALRWGAWLQVLTWILQAARALGDRLAEGWALHQIGSHALCSGNFQVAHSFLTQALTLRQEIGDQAGLAVTQHNLDLLLGPLAPPSRGKPRPPKQPPSAPRTLVSVLKWFVPLIGVAGLVAAVVLFWNYFPWVHQPPAPTERPTSTRVPPIPSRTPTRFIPSPDLRFSLDAGCGQTFPPGSQQRFTYTSNMDGWVTIQLYGEALPDVNRKPALGNTQYSGQVPIPDKAGEYVLTAIFDTGTVTITRDCNFIVAQALTPIPPPVINLWLDPIQCGGQYILGNPVTIHVLTNQDGWVDYAIHSAREAPDAWHLINPLTGVSSEGVKAGQEATLGWSGPDRPGQWTLRASLNKGAATATCDLQVIENAPPALTNISLTPLLPCGNQMVQATVQVADDHGIDNVELYYLNLDTNNFEPAPGNRVDDTIFQFPFFASIEVGTPFYVTVTDTNGVEISTQGQPNQAWSGFEEIVPDPQDDAVFYHYCAAFLILPQTDLPTMDLPDMPTVVDSWYECMTRCDGNSGCATFAFDPNASECWLKNGTPAGKWNQAFTSGIKSTVPIPP